MNSEALIKDDTYYFVDGNQEFRVGDYLFKLHGSILSMHSNFYRNMFGLPQAPDNKRDEEIIECDDSPDAFRALCWAIYAGPFDTGKETEITAVNVKKIAHIGLLAHKYEFLKIEEWIIGICGQLPTPEILMGFQPDDLKYLAHVVSHCDWKKVKIELHNRMVDGVHREKNASSIASASTLSTAVQVAEYIGDDHLQGRVYYAFLVSAGWDLHLGERQKQRPPLELDDMAAFSTLVPLSSLSDQQQLRLFKGFSSLRTLRSRLRYMPVLESFPAACDSTTWLSCHREWNSWWLAQVERFDALVQMDGPLDFFTTMIKRASSDPPQLRGHANSETKECIGHVTTQLLELKNAFCMDLPNYFK